MTSATQSLFTRDDTIFGVCEGLGQDLGINPNILRIAFGVSLLGNPLFSLGAYLACGVLVAVVRRLYPVANRSAAAAPVAETGQPIEADNDTHAAEFAKAA